jgi:hypothetical protein
VRVDDVCDMSDEYLDAALSSTGGNISQIPLLIASDSRSKSIARACALIAKYNTTRRVVWTGLDRPIRLSKLERQRQKLTARRSSMQSDPLHQLNMDPCGRPRMISPDSRTLTMRQSHANAAVDAPVQHVDFLLLVRSRFFIGNAASTFSANVARVRTAQLGEPFSNLRRCPHYP